MLPRWACYHFILELHVAFAFPILPFISLAPQISSVILPFSIIEIACFSVVLLQNASLTLLPYESFLPLISYLLIKCTCLSFSPQFSISHCMRSPNLHYWCPLKFHLLCSHLQSLTFILQQFLPPQFHTFLVRTWINLLQLKPSWRIAQFDPRLNQGSLWRLGI